MKHHLLTSILIPVLATSTMAAPDWLQWRGPTRDGQIHQGAPKWPDRLTKDNLTPRWSVELAEGYSSPIISGDRIFTVETRDKKDEVVRAFNRKTGKQLWEYAWAGSMKVPFFARKNGSWVRSTPACDGKTLFVGGMRDVLVAIDVTNGKERWRVDYPASEETPRPQFGFVSSPLLDKDHLYVQVGTALRKIRKSDGKTIWKALEDDRAMFGSAFSSPVRTKIGGRDQILVQTRTALGGIDPADGSILWSTPVKAFRGMNILTPTILDKDRIFTASYGGGTFLFDVKPNGPQQNVTATWNNPLEGNMSSPVVINGMVYLQGRDKRFHCIDPTQQKVLWSTEKTFGDYWSLVANHDRILALDNRGQLLLIQADPTKFRPIDTLEISHHPTWAHLTVCGNEIFIRNLKGLSSYHWK